MQLKRWANQRAGLRALFRRKKKETREFDEGVPRTPGFRKPGGNRLKALPPSLCAEFCVF